MRIRKFCHKKRRSGTLFLAEIIVRSKVRDGSARVPASIGWIRNLPERTLASHKGLSGRRGPSLAEDAVLAVVTVGPCGQTDCTKLYLSDWTPDSSVAGKWMSCVCTAETERNMFQGNSR